MLMLLQLTLESVYLLLHNLNLVGDILVVLVPLYTQLFLQQVSLLRQVLYFLLEPQRVLRYE